MSLTINSNILLFHEGNQSIEESTGDFFQLINFVCLNISLTNGYLNIFSTLKG